MVYLKKAFVFAAFTMGLMFSSWAHAEGNAIESISVVKQGGTTVLKVDLTEPLATLPTGFAISSPPRIAFDFVGIDNALGKTAQEIKEGELVGFNVIQSGGRTRLVLNLVQSLNYAAKAEGNSLLISLFPPVAPGVDITTAEAGVPEASGTQQNAEYTIRDIAFRRGEGGDGRVIVDLTDPSVSIDIKQQGYDLVVEFAKATLPASLRRRMDVRDFATPVNAIAAEDKGGKVRMTISAKGHWEHNAYQTETQLVVEIKDVIKDPRKLVQGTKTGYQGPRISINYQNGDVRTLLRLMAEELGLNAVISETVGGVTTLVLKDVPADQVMDLIFKQKGLDMRRNGNVIIMGPRDELATRERLELESIARLEDLEPLQTETFQLNYHNVDDFKKILADSGQRILSKRGSVSADPRTNIMFIRDTPSRMEELRRVIAKTDVPMRQVLIEARIVEARDNFARDLGVRLGLLHGKNYTDGGAWFGMGGDNLETLKAYNSSSGSRSDLSNPVGGIEGSAAFPAFNQVNLPVSPANGPAQLFSFLLANRQGTRMLNLEISALEADNRGRVVSSPRVLTSDKGSASIEQGTEIPYQEASSSGATGTSFKKAVLSLEVTPNITPDGRVSMEIQINKDTPNLSIPGQAPAIDTRKVRTTVLVDNGGTVVIGGIYELDEAEGTNKVPVLGDLPVLGYAFRNNTRSTQKRELLVFITPRIVNENLSVR
ncbi:MAG: type IV pilus secretin PilQ [Zoogloeaceae bacterium]|jgi:type IV pilus assembly protein PilQ|nr:type IV pilus secretin PilQ [Zoogloeaceae bacterium]